MRSPTVVLLLLAALAAPAAAQSLRQDSLPPLPATIRLYGQTISTGADLPTFEASPGAVALTVDEAVTLALFRNPAQRASNLEALRAATDVTRGNAGYAPVVDAQAGLRGSRSGSTGGGTGGSTSDSTGGSTGSTGRVRESTALTAGVSAGMTLLDFGGRAAALRRLQADARRFALGAEADAEALALATTTALLDVARQAALVDARAEAVGVSTDRLRIAAAEVRIGTAAEVDAGVALTDLNADRAQLLQQRIALAGARATLGGLLGLPDPEAVTVLDTLRLGPAPDLPALVARVGAGNRRVRSLGAAIEAAEAVTAEVRSQYLPALRATADVGVSALDAGLLPPTFAPAFGTDTQVGLGVSVPLFDGGERRRRLAVARIRVQQAEADQDDARLTALADAARLAASVRGQRALAALEAGNEVVARQNVRVALAQLRLGFITPFDLRLVQLALVDVQVRRVEAVYQARTAEAGLRQLAGTLLPAGGPVPAGG